MSTMDLLISVACIAIILIVVFVMWRIRRLKLRIGDSHIEYFPPRPDTTAKEGEGH
jgi:FtsZ-interacting cell division protein ZipA